MKSVWKKMPVESIGKIYRFSCTFHGYHLVAIGKWSVRVVTANWLQHSYTEGKVVHKNSSSSMRSQKCAIVMSRIIKVFIHTFILPSAIAYNYVLRAAYACSK